MPNKISQKKSRVYFQKQSTIFNSEAPIIHLKICNGEEPLKKEPLPSLGLNPSRMHGLGLSDKNTPLKAETES
jgi:hypothetical protein